MKKTLFPFLAFALFVPAAPAQSLLAASTFGNGDNGTFVQHTAEAATGPLVYSDSQAFAYGATTFQGTTRTTSEYGKIGVYSRSDLDNGGLDAPTYSYTNAGGGFLDPLAISGGSAGGLDPRRDPPARHARDRVRHALHRLRARRVLLLPGR